MKNQNKSMIDAFIDARHALVKLYSTSKGKRFVHHLIYAFTKSPVNFIYYAAGPLYDCITKYPIRSVSTKSEPLNDSYLNNEFKKLTLLTGEDKIKAQEEFQSKIKDYLVVNPIKRIACRSELSNKLLGYEEYLALMEFASNESNSGNSIIAGIIGYKKPKRSRHKTADRDNILSHIDNDTLTKLKGLYEDK